MWCCLPVCFGDGGCYFLARGGIPGHVPGHALLFSGSLINSVQAMPFSFQASVIFCTGEGLLRYGIRIRCQKRLPGVRDAHSEAFGVKNRLFRYGRNIRYQKRPPTVRDACAVMCPPRMVLPLFTKVGIVFNKTVIFDLLTNKQEEHSLLYKPKVSIFAA